MGDGTEAIEDDEVLLRRVPHVHIKPNGLPADNKVGFKPDRKRDSDGLSLFRQKYHSPQEIVERAGGKGPYYVARFRAKSLRGVGMALEPKPTVDFPGHCVISNLHALNREDERCQNWQMMLAGGLQAQLLGPLEKSSS